MKRILFSFLLTLTLAIGLYGCGGFGAGGDSFIPELKDGEAYITKDGGSAVVQGSGSPIYGSQIEVPEGALNVTEKIGITYFDPSQLPELPEDVTVASKGILLTKSGSDTFIMPVTVTITYDPAIIDDDDVPLVFYYDETTGSYQPFAIIDIDRDNHTVTVQTIHFCKVVVLKKVRTTSVDTGFRSNADGFFHPNFGTFDAPGGCGFGMATFAPWYYSNLKDQTGLYNQFRDGDTAKWEDDTVARELISRAFMASADVWSQIWKLSAKPMNGKDVGKILLGTMETTGEPQVLLLKGNTWGHAITVYKYGAKGNGYAFYGYDSNFPGEEVTLEWDATNGFGAYSKIGAYTSVQDPVVVEYCFQAFSTAFESKFFGDLYADAVNGFPSSKFQTINVTAPSLTNDTAILTDGNNVLVTGYASGGQATAKYLVWQLNGGVGTSGNLVTLAGDGSFSFTIPNLPLTKNTLMLMTTDNAADASRMRPSGYAGFKLVTLKVTGNVFFANTGFETGDFTSWQTKTEIWYETTINNSYTHAEVWPVDGQTYQRPNGPTIYGASTNLSGIETAGTDPIYSSLQKVYSGTYSARINDDYGNNHISTFTQTATVPNISRPELRFNWAAVLEDPSHPMEAQPFVEIKVTDDTAGTTLYHVYYYSFDPWYGGWVNLGGWKAIGWQTVNIDLSNVIGHDVTLKVIGADCAYGGHGGYVYLDAEE